MPTQSMRFAVAGFLLLCANAPAKADCVEEPRQVALDKDNAVKLKAYRCGTEQGQTGSQFRLEFHRLSQTAASLVVGQVESALLRATLGSPKVLQNEVFGTYADLLKQFGLMMDVPKPTDDSQATASISAADGIATDRVRDSLSASKLRSFPRSDGDFPSPDEIAALRKKTIPSGMKLFYVVMCQDGDADSARNPICKTYDAKGVTQKFWRGLRADDVTNYGQRIKDYNTQLAKYVAEMRAARKKKSDNPPSQWSNTAVPSDLRLLKYVAGDNWPEDLAVLAGFHSPDACNPQHIDDWFFNYYGRDVLLDVALIENTSTQPIKIAGLLGNRAAEPRLRAASDSATSAPGPLGDMAETLAPGQKLLVPTGVLLVPPRGLRGEFPYPQAAEDVYRQLQGNGYKGNPTAFGTPAIRDYVFGTALSVTGIVIDGKRVNLAQRRSANFFDLTMSSETGSCPYLSSFDNADGEWTEHGKVLHRATGKSREETESRTFAGFRSRFQLTEREPELAHIDYAALHVTLASGETVLLSAGQPELAARDGDYVRLFWGDALDLTFELPAGVNAEDVVTSRLDITGYYERYSALMARADEPVRATLLRRKSAAAPQSACPLPARPVSFTAVD